MVFLPVVEHSLKRRLAQVERVLKNYFERLLKPLRSLRSLRASRDGCGYRAGRRAVVPVGRPAGGSRPRSPEESVTFTGRRASGSAGASVTSEAQRASGSSARA